MALVRVRVGDREFNVGAAYAESHKLTVLDDEPTHTPTGEARPVTRAGGRKVKPKTSVAESAAKKKAAAQPDPADANPPSSKE